MSSPKAFICRCKVNPDDLSELLKMFEAFRSDQATELIRQNYLRRHAEDTQSVLVDVDCENSDRNKVVASYFVEQIILRWCKGSAYKQQCPNVYPSVVFYPVACAIVPLSSIPRDLPKAGVSPREKNISSSLSNRIPILYGPAL